MVARLRYVVFAALILAISPLGAQSAERWSKEKAEAWGKKMPWLVGCNFITGNAVNQLEMWQGDTFDPVTIDRELGLAESLGFNSVRVFLHDLPYKDDGDGFLKRIDTFLGLAEKHKIGVMFVRSTASGTRSRSQARSPRPRRTFITPGGCRARGSRS